HCLYLPCPSHFSFFFFNAPPTPALYTLSLHDALPISDAGAAEQPGRIELPGPCPHIAGVVERGHIEHLRQPGSQLPGHREIGLPDRKSTRLNSSHVSISYAVFCLKKKIMTQGDGCVRP